MDQQGITYCTTVTPNHYFHQCTVSQSQEATTSQAMVQQHDWHSAVTTSAAHTPSAAHAPSAAHTPSVSMNVHNTAQLTGLIQHQPSNSICVSSHAAVSTIQQGCSFLQSNSIQSSNSSYVLPATGNANVISGLPNQTVIFQSVISKINVTSTIHLSAQPNTNPFYVKFIVGNMRVCQGCRGNLKRLDGSVPAPPFDLCAARAERRSFRDSNGILITPQKEQPSHYHLNLSCIRVVAPTFVTSSLVVPPDVRPKLNVVHKEYLHLVFNVTVD